MRLPLPPQAQTTQAQGTRRPASQRAGPLCSFNMPSCHYPEPWGSWELGTVPVRPEGGASSQRGGSPVLRPNGICPARSWTNLKPIIPFFFLYAPWNGNVYPMLILSLYFGSIFWFHRFIAGEDESQFSNLT